jgi:tetratricopeptide (TPR) repeat protein
MLSFPAFADGYHDFNAGVAAAQHYDSAHAVAFLTSALTAADLPAELRAPAYLARGEEYAETGKLDAAIADFSSAIQLKPNDPDGYLARARAYFVQDAFDKAIADSTVAVQMEPKNWRYRLQRFDYYMAVPDWKDAISDYSEFIAARHPDASLLLGRADYYRAELDFDKALADERAAIELQPTAHAYGELANTYIRMNDFKDAIDSANSAIDKDSDNVEWYTLRGGAQWAMADYAAAADSFEDALSRHPHTGYAFMWLSIVLARQNEKVPDKIVAPFSDTRAVTWVEKLVLIYLGKGDPKALVDVAMKTRKAERGQRCGVGFFVGEWFQMQGDSTNAKATFQEASEDLCKDDPYQNHLLSIDLARMR